MNLLPKDEMTIKSPSSPEEMMEEIKKVTQVQDRLSFTAIRYLKSDVKKFAGEVRENAFKISRIIIGRNSFLPVIEGKVESDGEGSKADIKLSISKITSGAMIIAFILLLGMIIVPLISEGVTPKTTETTVVWVVIGLVVYGFMMFSFKSEAKRAKKLLNKILGDSQNEQ